MKKQPRNHKGQYKPQHPWYIYHYEKLLFVIFALLALYAYTSDLHRLRMAEIDAQRIFCNDEYLSPVSCDVMMGIDNFEMDDFDGWRPAPHAWEIYQENREAGQAGEIVEDKVLTEGKSSWYEANPDGCVGCALHYDENGEIYFIMANGERLSDSDLTLAVTPELMSEYKLLNDNVLVTNLENGKTLQARITDTGGFGKYNRVADLSVGLSQMLECYNCKVRIEKI